MKVTSKKMVEGKVVIYRSPSKMILVFLLCALPAAWFYSEMDSSWVLRKPEGIPWLWATIAFLSIGAVVSLYQLTRVRSPEITISKHSLSISGIFGKRVIPWSIIHDVRSANSGRFQAVVLAIRKEDLDMLSAGTIYKLLCLQNKRTFGVWCIAVTAAGLRISHLDFETVLIRSWNNSKIA